MNGHLSISKREEDLVVILNTSKTTENIAFIHLFYEHYHFQYLLPRFYKKIRNSKIGRPFLYGDSWYVFTRD